MSLKDKYGITQTVWMAMIRDGVIGCSVSRQEEILSCYQRQKNAGQSHSSAVKATALEINVSDQWVYEVLRKYQS